MIKTSGGTTVQDDKFTYDVESRRIGKNTLSGGQTWTAYVDFNPFMDFNSSGSLLSLWTSTNGGTAWAQLTATPNYMGTSGSYDSALAVDARNPAVVYAAGATGSSGMQQPRY